MNDKEKSVLICSQFHTSVFEVENSVCERERASV